MNSTDHKAALHWSLSAALLAIVLADGLMLHSIGRGFWCSCGSLVPWSWEPFSQHNSQHLVDWYSPSHITHGVTLYGLLFLVARRLPVAVRLVIATLIESVWEIAENSPFIIERYRSATISLNYYGDSVLNSVSDISMCIFGFFLAARLPIRVTLAITIASELLTLVIIRDNLTLNVLMLLWPVEAIKQWQSGIAPAH